MNATEKKRKRNFAIMVVKQIREQREGIDDAQLKQLITTPDSKMILHRAFQHYNNEPTREGWNRRKILNYGAKCAARSILMSEVPCR